MQVAFERGSHLFWSVGKDRMVKYWDGDKVSSLSRLGEKDEGLISSGATSLNAFRSWRDIREKFGHWQLVTKRTLS